MQRTYNYIGLFFDYDRLHQLTAPFTTGHLEKMIMHPHVTFFYRPSYVPEQLFGTQITIRIIGYGNDGTNEGLRVELSSDIPELQKMIANIPVPHITLSVSDSGRPVDTCHLDFAPVDPVTITGTFGGFVSPGYVVFSPLL